jgi:hypothetical protein
MKKETYFKLLLELVVIFLSVVLAFFFDDFREARNEKIQYKTDLLTFRNELVSTVNDMSIKLDTFTVQGDIAYRGTKFKRLVNLNWFDSLLRIRKASMNDFRYLTESDYLIPEFGEYNKIPLANEIRVKYTEYFNSKDLLNNLNIYEQEMKNLSNLNQVLVDSYKDLDRFLMKMDPYLNFDKQDSLLLYSKEFIWAFNSCNENYKSEFQFTKWLVQKRFIKVINSVNHELESLGVALPNDLNCYSPDFPSRFECSNNRKIQIHDSISRVDNMTIKNRSKYLKLHLKEITR